MASLSSKLGAGVPTIGLLANKGRILAVGTVNLKVGSYRILLPYSWNPDKYGDRKLVSRNPDHGRENHNQDPDKHHGRENHDQDPDRHHGKENKTRKNHNQDPGKHYWYTSEQYCIVEIMEYTKF
jgi:hypothetical protein